MNFQLYNNTNIPDDEDIGVSGSGTINSMILSQLVPEEYLFDPLNAEPTLDNLREAAIQYAKQQILLDDGTNVNNNDSNRDGNDTDDQVISGWESTKEPSKEKKAENKALKELLDAAEKDVHVHLSRIKAVLAQDPKLLETYKRDADPDILSRRKRLEEMQEQRRELGGQIRSILNGLTESLDMNSPSKQPKHQGPQGQGQGQESLTQASIVERRLLSWTRALELYIYDSGENVVLGGESNNKNGDGNSTSATAVAATAAAASAKNLTMNQLLQHLCLASVTDDEETMTQALLQASKMTSLHLERTSKLLEDAVEETASTLQSYHIHLIAHSIAAQTTMKKTGDIQNKFLNHGKEALKIGHALELEEGKRYQSEHASLLLKRWWMMENLADQENASGETIQVHEEVWGVIPSSSCKLDPLFTRKENSVEAAKALKSLRTIVKCRSNVAKNSNGGKILLENGQEQGGVNDSAVATKRFELTGTLIQRTSAELEQRLLNTFSEIYSEGGTYDFSSVLAGKRPGRLNWIMLREVAEALMSFDSGRSLLKRYVALVVSIKFPELYTRDEDNNDTESMEEKSAEEDIDGTRSKLSSLFHRVCEVCTEEFKLIAHVFSPSLPEHLQESTASNNKPKSVVNWRASFPESFALQVTRGLIKRLISDPKNGMQAHINGLLESIDRKGDFDSGAKKLDTFVVVHEKAAGLFHLLKEAAQKMWGIHDAAASKNLISANGFSDSSDGQLFNVQSTSALIQFLTTQEMALSNSQRQGYLNLELRLLHHHCCATLDRSGGKLLGPIRTKEDSIRNSVVPGGLADYRAPIMPLDQDSIRKRALLPS
jgi:Exocyst complex component Sec10.